MPTLSSLETIRYIALIFGSEIAAFLITLIVAPRFIKILNKYKIGKQLRTKASTGEIATIFNELHAKKKGTPTMGGILIWGSTIIVVLLSGLSSMLGITEHSLWNRKETWLPLFTLITTAILGAVDDYLNIKGNGNKGLNIKPKFLWMTLLAALGAWWFHFRLGYDQIHIPLLGNLTIGFWYIPLFIFVITATANAVNITDGLDGLAGGLLIIAFGSFSIIAYAKGLLILSALCAVVVGALIGFLWFNIFPAHFYMGDTGALSLGAMLGVIAIMTDSVAILPLIGFIFVVETVSVIIQLIGKKFLKRKIFKIAPLHHHFEKSGWSEPNIVMRFWIMGGFVAVLGVIIGMLSSKS